MPFSEIQKRLGRKQVSEQLMKEVPVAYVVFDVLYAEGELTLAEAAVGTRAILDRVFSGARRVEPKPLINAQGQLLFEAEIQPQAPRDGYFAHRRHAPTRSSSLSSSLPKPWRAATKG